MTTDDNALGHIVRLAYPAMQSTHQSTWSAYVVTLPSGKPHFIVVPPAAVPAIEAAGYEVKALS